MKIAITGASGFLGKYLTKYLAEVKHINIYAIVREQKSLADISNRNIRVISTNYSVESLISILEDVDIVIHLAAQTMSRTTDSLKISSFYFPNVLLTENILNASHKASVKSVYIMSSNNVYSLDDNLPYSESHAIISSTPYGISKVYAEILGEYFSQKTSVKVISLRLARLFGYGERDSVIFTKFMNQAVSNQTLEVWGTGETSIEYLYVKDAVSAIYNAILQDIPSGIYNVGVNKTYTISDIAYAINDVTCNKGGIKFLYEKEERKYKILMDSTKFYNITKWSPSWSLKGAIEDIYQYYLHGKEDLYNC